MTMGYWTRSNPEICLMATRGQPTRLAADVRELIEEPLRQHSQKPDRVRDDIERLVAGPHLEMFAHGAGARAGLGRVQVIRSVCSTPGLYEHVASHRANGPDYGGLSCGSPGRDSVTCSGLRHRGVRRSGDNAQPWSAMSNIEILRQQLLRLYHEHLADDMIPTSARFLFYEFVQGEIIPKHADGVLKPGARGQRRPDQNMSDALTSLRESGQIPWQAIVDETRSLDDFTGFRDDCRRRGCVLDAIRLDPWKGNAPVILTESRSLGRCNAGASSVNTRR